MISDPEYSNGPAQQVSYRYVHAVVGFIEVLSKRVNALGFFPWKRIFCSMMKGMILQQSREESGEVKSHSKAWIDDYECFPNVKFLKRHVYVYLIIWVSLKYTCLIFLWLYFSKKSRGWLEPRLFIHSQYCLCPCYLRK